MKIKCPKEGCGTEMKLGEGFGECEVGLCICQGASLAVTGRKEARQVIGKRDCLPLKKGDLAIIRTTCKPLRGPAVVRYRAEYVGAGGKKPRDAGGSPIDPLTVVSVVRPGWPVKSFVPSAVIPESAIREAWENREEQ